MNLEQLHEARYLSTEFVEVVSTLLDRQVGSLHSAYIDIKAVPDAVRQLTKVFGEPHISKNAIKDDHGLGNKIPRMSDEYNSFIAYSWEGENIPARYIALDVYTDGREDTATIYVDKR